MELIIIALIFINIILTAIIFRGISKQNNNSLQNEITKIDTMMSVFIDKSNAIGNIVASTEGQIKTVLQAQKDIDDKQKGLEPSIKASFNVIKDLTSEALLKISNKVGQLETSMQEANLKNMQLITDTMNKRLETIENTTSNKLSEIQNNVNNKLEESLNKRLDESFKQVGNRLEALYKSLGELSNLQDGVNNLNRTLSNVKTRGVFGEAQLGQLLASVFGEPGQVYVKNIITKTNSSDFVEYAIKLPDNKSQKGFVYMPIDSKMHSDIYNRIQLAAEQADQELLNSAIKNLKQIIIKDAEDISSKYLDPVNTTEFAIMFLPTEGLYAEALRIDGLSEYIQKEFKVVIAGPTTLIALLNSFAIGFSYMKLNENAKDIENALSMFKSEFKKFNDYIAKSKKKLQETQNVIDELEKRSRVTQKKLSKLATLEAIDDAVTKEQLGITDEMDRAYQEIAADLQ